MRTLIDRDPYLLADAERPWRQQGLWPCAWIRCPGAAEPPMRMAG